MVNPPEGLTLRIYLLQKKNKVGGLLLLQTVDIILYQQDIAVIQSFKPLHCHVHKLRVLCSHIGQRKLS